MEQDKYNLQRFIEALSYSSQRVAGRQETRALDVVYLSATQTARVFF